MLFFSNIRNVISVSKVALCCFSLNNFFVTNQKVCEQQTGGVTVGHLWCCSIIAAYRGAGKTGPCGLCWIPTWVVFHLATPGNLLDIFFIWQRFHWFKVFDNLSAVRVIFSKTWPCFFIFSKLREYESIFSIFNIFLNKSKDQSHSLGFRPTWKGYQTKLKRADQTGIVLGE